MSRSPPSSSPPPAPAAHEGDAAAVTSRLYLHRPGAAGPLEKDAVLRRIRHRRRANRLRDTLRSLLLHQQPQQAAPELPEDDGERPAWLADDAFSAP